MKTVSTLSLDEKIKALIIERWRTSKLNSIPDIAKEFKISKYKTHTVINEYLASKINS